MGYSIPLLGFWQLQISVVSKSAFLKLKAHGLLAERGVTGAAEMQQYGNVEM